MAESVIVQTVLVVPFQSVEVLPSARSGRAVPGSSRRAVARATPCLLLALLTFGTAQTAATQNHTLTASPNPVAVFRTVLACWTAPSGSSAFDYVALHEVGAPTGSYVSFEYTNGTTSGCAALFVGISGSYNVRYLLDNGQTVAATSNTVNVVEQPGFFSLSATPNQVVIGRQVYACWSNSAGSPTASDTVGLFDALSPTGALASQPTGGTDNGCAALTIPGPGPYEVRYLYQGDLDVAGATFSPIPSPGSYGLTASPDPVAIFRVVYGCWTAPPGSSVFDYVALHEVGAPTGS